MNRPLNRPREPTRRGCAHARYEQQASDHVTQACGTDREREESPGRSLVAACTRNAARGVRIFNELYRPPDASPLSRCMDRCEAAARSCLLRCNWCMAVCSVWYMRRGQVQHVCAWLYVTMGGPCSMPRWAHGRGRAVATPGRLGPLAKNAAVCAAPA